MPINDAEYNSLVGRLRAYTTNLVETYPALSQDKVVKGNIGEKFVGYCIFHGLWRLGYALYLSGFRHSFRIQPKYGANAQGQGGVDFRYIIANLDESRYRFLIECKNWDDDYHITRNMFENEIYDRFGPLDVNQVYYWILTMNTRNIDEIRILCEDVNIHILPMRNQITPDNISSDTVMRPLFSEFIDAFMDLMKTLAPESSYPEIHTDGFEGNKSHYIIQDLLLCVPYPLIEERYDCSRGYIAKLASYVRKWRIPIPDRRSRNWREIWELQE